MILRYHPHYDLDALKAGADLEALVRSAGVDLRKEASGSLKGPCPWCGGTDRLVVRPNGRDGLPPAWWCRRCRPEAGSALDFVMARERLDLAEAAEWLARWAGLDATALSAEELAARQAEATVRREASQARELAHREAARQHLAAAYRERELQAALARHADVIAALVAGGISEYAQERFGFGFAVYAGRPALTIPWYRARGTLEALQYRFLDDQDADRYRWAKGTSGTLWHGQAVSTPTDGLLLVAEGAKKAAAAWCAGVRSVVAVPNNTSAGRILSSAADALAAFDRVLVCLDPDSPGDAREAAGRLPNGRVLDLPDKLDDWLLTHGAGGGEALRARMAGARG